jgi:hypothetical protein
VPAAGGLAGLPFLYHGNHPEQHRFVEWLTDQLQTEISNESLAKLFGSDMAGLPVMLNGMVASHWWASQAPIAVGRTGRTA